MEIDNNTTTDEINMVDLVVRCLHHWKLFCFSIISCIVIAAVHLICSIPEYKVTSTVVIKDEKKGNIGTEYTVFKDLGIISSSENLENELEVLKSKSIFNEMAERLNLHFSFHAKNRLGLLVGKLNLRITNTIGMMDIYKQSPIFVTSPQVAADGTFIIDRREDGSFYFHSQEPKVEQTIQFDTPMETFWGPLIFTLNPLGWPLYPLTVKIVRTVQVPSKLSISSINKISSVVELSITTSNARKGEDIINTLIAIYNQRAIDEKNYVAINTTKFIDERLAIISGELSEAERNVEKYRLSKGITDIEAEARLFLSTSTSYDQQISNTEIQLGILRNIKQFLDNPANLGSVVPTNIGLTDPTIINLISKYNEEVINKMRETTGMRETNPVLAEFNYRIAILRSNLLSGIGMAESSLQTTLRELRAQEASYTVRTLQLTTQERESRELYRQKDIKESLFIYLLQKREETSLSMALATPNAKIVDTATPSERPVTPKKRLILISAFLLGFILPLVYIFIVDLFDVKLRSRDQLIRAVQAPFIGDIPQDKTVDNFPVRRVRTCIAERFRLICANLRFMSVSQTAEKIIMVTSTTGEEGKSFVSRNLALSLATTGKRTLLIDMDMRRSQMANMIIFTTKKCLSVYLSEPQTTVDEIIERSHKLHANLDIIPVQLFPPNPAELLGSHRLAQLFTELEGRYDYIVLDTAPAALVSDAFTINHFATATIYVTRENHTHIATLAEVQHLYQHEKLKNLTVVLNGVENRKGDYRNSGYGYGYGKNYYHDDE